MKIKSIFSGSALLCSALLGGSLVLSARTLSAETLLSQLSQQDPKQAPIASETAPREAAVTPGNEAAVSPEVSLPKQVEVPPVSYVATAYSLKGKTASGRLVSKGLIAADPRVLPLGSRVRLEAGNYTGEYVVADTGGAVRGRHIDIWTPTSREAMRFGRRLVKLTVLTFGGHRRATRSVTR